MSFDQRPLPLHACVARVASDATVETDAAHLFGLEARRRYVAGPRDGVRVTARQECALNGELFAGCAADDAPLLGWLRRPIRRGWWPIPERLTERPAGHVSSDNGLLPRVVEDAPRSVIPTSADQQRDHQDRSFHHLHALTVRAGGPVREVRR